ncbi:amino acid adenylation domain-containing protein [Nocardia sp. NPDC052566]|uniref:amino acid adenylation domain-containing protein n=1 Tax=Nocardia sp. NPDC052566 TaxID=3364330 RepID=UPI0037CC48F6
MLIGDESRSAALSSAELSSAELRYRQSGKWSADRAYWSTRLADAPRPEQPSALGPTGVPGSLRVTIDAASLTPIARRGGGGTAAVLLAAVAAFAHRCTGAAEIVIAYRADGALTPIRLAVTPRDTLAALAVRAGAELRAARRHRFLAAFDDPWPEPDARVWGLVAEVNADGNNGFRPAEDSALTVLLDDRLAGQWTADVHASAGAVGRFARLLNWCAGQPDRAIGAADLDTAEERDRLIEFGNTTAHPVDPAATLLRAFEDQVRRTPGSIAVRADGLLLDYAEFAARVHRLARWLIDAGVGPETLVAVSMARSVEQVVALYAVLAAGGAYLPIDPAHPESRSVGVLRATRPVCLLTRSGEQAPKVDGLRAVAVDELDTASYSVAAVTDSERRAPLRPDNLAYVIFTSGSTGSPKGVAVTHAAIVNQLEWMAEHHRLAPDDVYLLKTAMTFDPSLWGLFLPLRLGAALALARPDGHLDPVYLAELIARDRVTVTDFVPSLLSVLARHPAMSALGTLRQLFVIGEQLPPATVAAVGAGVTVHNLYGPTEVAVSVTTHRSDASDAEVVPIGTPAWNTRVYVLDSSLRPTPPELVGELYLSGIQLARGYFGRGAATAERFVADPYGGAGARMYRTGDLVRRRADGALIFVGRADSQVKVRGQRIELGEIETALSAHPDIERAVVILRDDRLVAYLVLAQGRQEPALAEWLSGRLPAAMAPSAFVVLDRIPLTSNGKLDKRALPAPVADLPEYRAPAGTTEAMVADSFTDVLGIPQVGAHDSFFALGGDSIMSILLVARARGRGVLFTPQDVFEQRTVAGLAAVARTEGERRADVLAELPGGGLGEMPLPPVLRHLMDRAGGPERLAQSLALRLPTGIDRAALVSTLRTVVDRHDMLRARLYRESGEWRLAASAPGAVDVDALVHRIVLDPHAETAAVLDIAAAARDSAIHRLDPANGIVLHCVWLDPESADAQGWLIMVLHHVAVDGVSWRILVPDLISAWSQLRAGRIPALPAPGTSMRRWAHALTAEAHRDERVAELTLWRSALGSGETQVGERPFDPDIDRASTVRHRKIEASIELTALIDAVGQRHRAEPQEVLVTALALALAAWRGIGARTLWLESHGREQEVIDGADLSRTVGWFTTVHPARIDLGGIDIDAALTGGPEARRALQRIKEQLRALPDHGIGYGLLRYLNAETAALLPASATEIGFRYLGRTASGHAGGSAWLPAVELSELPEPAIDAPAAAAIDVAAIVVDDRLHTSFAYPRTLLSDSDIGALGELWTTALTALCAPETAHGHGAGPLASGRTSSDLALVRPDQDEIERWERRYPGLLDVWPLTPLQAGLHFHAVLARSSFDAYHVQTVFTLTGAVERARLRDSLQCLLDRHDSLRGAVVTRADGTAVQVVVGAVPMPWREIDLRDQADPEAALADLIDADRGEPFRLDTPPLLRGMLITLRDNDFRLIVTNHHLLMDGWSMPIVAAELLALYAADADPAVLPPVRGYRDFLVWLRRRDTAAAARAWRDAFADGVSPTLLAPEDRGRRIATAAGRFDCGLDEADSARLRALAAAHQVTVNTVLQCAWGITLALSTGRQDVVFGTTVAGRPAELAGVESMVGLFINTVPVRVRIREGDSMAQLLTRHQADQTVLVAHQHLGLPEILDAAGHTALFDTLLEFQSYPLDTSALDAYEGVHGLSITDFEVNDGTHYPITLVAALRRSRLSVQVGYLRECFDEPAVRTLTDRWMRVLAAMVANPRAPIDSVISAEPRRMPQVGTDIRRSIDPAATLPALVDAQCARTPDAVALEFDGAVLTYREFADRVHRLAHWLIGSGVGPETIVGLCIPRSIELVVAVHAVVAAGGCYVALDPEDPKERHKRIISATRPLCVLSLGRSTGLGTPWVVLDSLDLTEYPVWPVSNAHRRAPLRAANTAYVMFTSGSTGTPKGVAVSHAAIVNRLLWMAAEYPVRHGDAVLQKTPATFDVSVPELFGPLLTGARMVIAAPGGHRDPGYLAELIRSAGVTTAHFVPGLLAAFLARPDAAECRSLTRVFASGERLSAAIAQRAVATFPQAAVINLYGPTEAAVEVTAHEVIETDTRTVPIGLPVWNTRVHVLDSRLRPAPVGVAGEIYLAGAQVARGYLGQSGLTAERFVADPFDADGARMYRTGDLGAWNAAGELEFLGRNDGQLQLRGRRVEPGEIEAALCEHEGVAQAVVLPWRAPGGDDDVLVAYVAPDGRGGTPQAQRALVEEWARVHGSLYDDGASAPGFGADFRGWTSSYTRAPLPMEQMREWRDTTVARIRALNPRRVLEIGVGSGLLLAQLAPDCAEYVATDVSGAVTEALRTALGGSPEWAQRIAVHTRPADDFDGLPESHFDTVVLNSVAQYFPSASYLSSVIAGAMRVLTPGGALFIGDVRNLTLAPALATGIEMARTTGDIDPAVLAERVRRRLTAERELLLAPEYFTTVTDADPAIGGVGIHVKRGAADNELTRYRYDVVLHKNPVQARSVRSAPRLDFAGIDTLAAELRANRPQVVRVSGIPHAGVRAELAAAQGGGNAASDAPGLWPEQLHRLAAELGLAVVVTLSSTPGLLDAIFTDPAIGAVTDGYLPGDRTRHANDPAAASLAAELRWFLTDRLPAGLVPAAFVVVDQLPTSASGKLDRRALPAPEFPRGAYEPPHGPVEAAIAAAFAETLGVAQVGRADDFFALGGHSLTATRVVNLLRGALGTEVPIGELFAAPTVAELAARVVLGGQRRDRLVPMARPAQVPLSFAQRRVWFVHELSDGAPLYNIPFALRLRGALDIGAMRAALADVVARHESLRTIYPQVDGLAYQHILSPGAAAVDIPLVALDPADLTAALAERAGHRFDLSADLPLRAWLIRLREDEHVLVLVIHHIAADGWSMVPLARDMATAYAARAAGTPPGWDPLPVQYADYTLWQWELLGADNSPTPLLEDQVSYWRTELAALPPLRLPIDRPRPARPSGLGGQVELVLDAELLSAVEHYAAGRRATTSMALQAAFVVLLRRLGAGEDLAIGGPIAGRTDTALTELVGFFVNTWVLRVDLSGDPSFDTVVDRVRAKALAAYANQDAPFERLVELLAPPRSRGTHPLFQVMFAWQNNAVPEVGLPGVLATPVPITTGTAKMDLFFNLSAPADPSMPAGGVVEYATDLFERETVEAMVAQYLRLLAALVRDPERGIGALDPVSGTDARSLTDGSYT